MPAGRPTDYTEDMPQKVLDWLNEQKDELEQEYKKVKLPCVAALAVDLNIARSTVFEWAKKYPKFSDSLKKVLAEQERRLLSEGLSGNYNPTIAKLVLSSNHNYADKNNDHKKEKESLTMAGLLKNLNDKKGATDRQGLEDKQLVQDNE